MSRRRPSRAGFTLLELIAVMAALLILGAVVLPSVGGMARDTKVKAGADLLRQRVAEARSHSIGDGRVYRLSVSPDGQRVRVAPDADDPQTADPDAEKPFAAEDAFPDGVTVRPVVDGGDPPATDSAGWFQLATFLPDGTCREDSPEMEVREAGVYPIRVHVRGLTGATTVEPLTGGANP